MQPTRKIDTTNRICLLKEIELNESKEISFFAKNLRPFVIWNDIREIKKEKTCELMKTRDFILSRK